MAKKLSSDISLFAVTLILLGIGLVMVWSASTALAKERHDNAYYFLIRQVIWATVGLAGMVAAMRLDYRKLRQPVVVYSVVAATTALLILVLFLPSVNETHRWIRLGALSFQPSELAKLAVVLFLAYHLERRRERVNEFLPALFPALLLLGWFAFLVFIQPDLGTAATIALVGAVLLFLAGVKMRYFAALTLPALFFLYQAVMTAAYRRDRIEAFLNPYSDPRGSGYQIIQSLIAVGTGGITGLGLMEGRQKLFYLPYPYNDFIFAVIGEELGLTGTLVVLALFAALGIGLFRIVLRTDDLFVKIATGGVMTWVLGQAVVNIGAVLGLLPVVGVPLPLVSYGGTSFVTLMAGFGILMSLHSSRKLVG
jgi:cell division protein FtsW